MHNLRNESTGSSKSTWEKVDKAASRVPDWVRGHVDKVTSEKVSNSGSGEDLHKPSRR